MTQNKQKNIIDALKDFDTPAITNVIGSYPGESFCLGLYDPWKDNWYTDQTIRCMFPELRTYSRICRHLSLQPASS